MKSLFSVILFALSTGFAYSSSDTKIGGLNCRIIDKASPGVRRTIRYHYEVNDYPNFNDKVYLYRITFTGIEEWRKVADFQVQRRRVLVGEGLKGEFTIAIKLEFSNGGHLRFNIDSDNFDNRSGKFTFATGTFRDFGKEVIGDYRTTISEIVSCSGTVWDF